MRSILYVLRGWILATCDETGHLVGAVWSFQDAFKVASLPSVQFAGKLCFRRRHSYLLTSFLALDTGSLWPLSCHLDLRPLSRILPLDCHVGCYQSGRISIYSIMDATAPLPGLSYHRWYLPVPKKISGALSFASAPICQTPAITTVHGVLFPPSLNLYLSLPLPWFILLSGLLFGSVSHCTTSVDPLGLPLGSCDHLCHW